MTELKPPSPNQHEPERGIGETKCIIDQIDEEIVGYRDYYDVMQQRYPEIRQPLEKMQTRNREMYGKVLMGHNSPRPKDVESEPGDSDFDDGGTLLMKGVREWYQTLGSLNSLKGAEDDLLRGAMIILATNGGEDYVFQQEQQPSMVDAYMESSRANGLEKQESNEFLVLAGQMINEAALVAEDEETSHILLSQAAEIYSKVYKDPDAGWE